MINNQMKELIEKLKTLDMHDNISIQKIWNKEIEVLSFSLDDTINYLSSASEEEIYWCSNVWDDISRIFKSEKLIETMKNCKEKYPNIANSLEVDIKYAIEAMQNDKWYYNSKISI